jgi:uncharacterized protein
MRHDLMGPAGRLDAIVDEPGPGVHVRAAVVLAHPHPEYGGTMHTKAVYRAAKALRSIGCAVLRFNFRSAGTGAGTFSNGPGEMDDFRAGLDDVHGRYPLASLWAAGMSFGAWIAMTVGAEDPRVSTLIGISTPASQYDWVAVQRSPKPKFFIHGERDDISPLKDIRALYARAEEPKELVVIDAADHLFDGKVGEVADAIEELFADWNPEP